MFGLLLVCLVLARIVLDQVRRVARSMISGPGLPGSIISAFNQVRGLRVRKGLKCHTSDFKEVSARIGCPGWVVRGPSLSDNGNICLENVGLGKVCSCMPVLRKRFDFEWYIYLTAPS
jgi:hypothetical protein